MVVRLASIHQALGLLAPSHCRKKTKGDLGVATGLGASSYS